MMLTNNALYLCLLAFSGRAERFLCERQPAGSVAARGETTMLMESLQPRATPCKHATQTGKVKNLAKAARSLPARFKEMMVWLIQPDNIAAKLIFCSSTCFACSHDMLKFGMKEKTVHAVQPKKSLCVARDPHSAKLAEGNIPRRQAVCAEHDPLLQGRKTNTGKRVRRWHSWLRLF